MTPSCSTFSSLLQRGLLGGTAPSCGLESQPALRAANCKMALFPSAIWLQTCCFRCQVDLTLFQGTQVAAEMLKLRSTKHRAHSLPTMKSPHTAGPGDHERLTFWESTDFVEILSLCVMKLRHFSLIKQIHVELSTTFGSRNTMD